MAAAREIADKVRIAEVAPKVMRCREWILAGAAQRLARGLAAVAAGPNQSGLEEALCWLTRSMRPR